MNKVKNILFRKLYKNQKLKIRIKGLNITIFDNQMLKGIAVEMIQIFKN